MRGILQHLQTIRTFLLDRTNGKWDDVSDAVLRRLLMEAYNHIPLLLPLRLIITADDFADFLIDKKDDLLGQSAPRRKATTKKRATTRSTAKRKTTTKPKTTPVSTARARRRTPRSTTRRTTRATTRR